MKMFTWKTFVGGLAGHVFSLPNIFKSGKQSDAINEVLFYGGDDEETQKQVGLNNLFCIYYIIAHAGRTVDICIPSLDSDTITKCLIDIATKNNVKIRVAVQHEKDLCNLKNLTDNGIEIKVIRSKVKLEHEFILIDVDSGSDAVAMLGSIDYEVNRVNCCRDATILSSDTNLVQTLQYEFDRVWNTEENLFVFNQSDELEEIKDMQ